MIEKVKKINFLFFILLPFIDLVTALFTRFHPIPVSIGVVIKGLYTLLLGLYVLFFTNSKYKKILISYMISIFVFAFFYFVTKSQLWTIKNLISESITLYKFFFTSLFLLEMIIINKELEYQNSFYKKIMVYTILTYVVLLLVPYFTGTSFDAYRDNWRKVGNMGWFYGGNETSAILIICFPFLLLKFKSWIEENKKWFLLLVIPTVYAIFLLGTKVGWYGILVELLCMIIIYGIKERKNKFFVIFTSCIFLISCLLTLVSPANNNIKANIYKYNKNNKKNKTSMVIDEQVFAYHDSIVIAENTKEKKENTSSQYHKLNEVLTNKKLDKFLEVFLTGRQNKAYTLSIIYNDAKWADKFFGIGFTNYDKINNPYISLYCEIDMLDMLFHYGIVGMILILLPILYGIKNMYKIKLKEASSETVIFMLTTLLMLGLSCLSGHIIGYPSVGIYLVILMITVVNSMQTDRKKEKKA